VGGGGVLVGVVLWFGCVVVGGVGVGCWCGGCVLFGVVVFGGGVVWVVCVVLGLVWGLGWCGFVVGMYVVCGFLGFCCVLCGGCVEVTVLVLCGCEVVFRLWWLWCVVVWVLLGWGFVC
jgi:hypothetical protein